MESGPHVTKAEKANAQENFAIFSTRYVMVATMKDYANVNPSMLNCFMETNWLRKLVLATRTTVRSTSKPKSSKSSQTSASPRPNLCSGQSSWTCNVVSNFVS
jgi:hypothetical protein